MSPDERRQVEKAVYYLDCGSAEDCAQILEPLVQSSPEMPTVWATLGRAYLSLRRFQSAVEAFHRSLSLQPNDEATEAFYEQAIEGWQHVGGNEQDILSARYDLYAVQKKWSFAADVAARKVEHQPTDARAWTALATAHRFNFNFAEACAAHEKAVAQKRVPWRSRAAFAKTLWEMGDLDSSLGLYVDLMAQLPENMDTHADTQLAVAMIRLLQGEYKQGFVDYEARLRLSTFGFDRISQPVWQGEILADERLLIWREQGFGDAIQFARYAGLVRDRCPHVKMMAKPAMVRLLKSLPWDIDIEQEPMSARGFDRFIPMMSLMRVFETGLESIPWDGPYLSSSKENVSRLQDLVDLVPSSQSLKIGLAWAGSPTNSINWKKVLDPALFSPLLTAQSAHFFSLQVVREGMAPRHKKLPQGVIDISPHLRDFADTAAAIDCLDLVITVDTAIAHLAGAMGKPVWVMLPSMPDWRWGLRGETTPWYPTARLFRQVKPGDWSRVIEQIGEALKTFSL